MDEQNEVNVPEFDSGPVVISVPTASVGIVFPETQSDASEEQEQ